MVLAVFLATSVAGVVLSASITSGPLILAGRWQVLAALAVWGLVWAAGVAAALRLTTRASLVLILGVGLALRVVA
nr:hypothetical protein [Acidimicrobiia bacterium]